MAEKMYVDLIDFLRGASGFVDVGCGIGVLAKLATEEHQ
jgi:16S rRNA G1207 methylase RsmC